MSSVYKINKGINKPIVFKGLKAQYITWLAIGLVLLLILFAILYITGVHLFICLFVVFSLGTALFIFIYRLSDKYGQHGLTKKIATRSIPPYIKATSRRLFQTLNQTK
jgi:hypothetical protein